MNENVWEWEGKTRKSSDTYAYSISEPQDPFPEQDVIDTAKTAILSEISRFLTDEFRNQNIEATVTLIEPEVWIETVLYDVRQIKDHQHNWWHHWLHMKAKIHFTTDKQLAQSPLDPFTWAALATIIVKVVTVIAAAAVLYGIAKVFIESFFVETQHIQIFDPEGNLIEDIIKKTPKGQEAFWGIIALIAILVFVYFIWKSWKPLKRRKRRK